MVPVFDCDILDRSGCAWLSACSAIGEFQVLVNFFLGGETGKPATMSSVSREIVDIGLSAFFRLACSVLFDSVRRRCAAVGHWRAGVRAFRGQVNGHETAPDQADPGTYMCTVLIGGSQGSSVESVFRERRFGPSSQALATSHLCQPMSAETSTGRVMTWWRPARRSEAARVLPCGNGCLCHFGDA